MILLNQLSMAYAGKLLFDDVNIKLNDQVRYALVGANGTGKSTLLRLLTGEEQPSLGVISIPKEVSIGWLKQDQFRYENTRIVDVVIQGKPKLWAALEEKDELLTAEEYTEEMGYRLGELEEIIAHCDGYTAVPFAEKLLTGLGIEAKYHYEPLNALSGGYKLRVLLAQTLFQEPDILLLDEPTNHLDILSIAWLERFLKTEFSGLLVFISHDMDFINGLATYILNVDYGEVRQYSGNYQKFLAEKKLMEEQKLQQQKGIEDKIAHMQKFVDRFGAKASMASRAQSKAKSIEKVKLELPDIKNSSCVAPYFQFEQTRPTGKQVLKVSHLSKAYADNIVFLDLNFEITRGEKVAIVGVNGVGKSTLVKTILGKVKPDDGTYEWGHEIHTAYFSQDHHDEINKHMTVLKWMEENVVNQSDEVIRRTLGQMLFKKGEVQKDILALSGGEAARLLLGRMMLQKANVLVLDEPTNHMDLDATEALADALVAHPGTVITVSHNRHFLSKVAKRILFVTHEGVKDFQGTYAQFEKAYEL